MAKPSKMVSKTLEVIWDRNGNTRGTKSLPRMKEINIDDSVIKVKKSSKCKYFSRDIRINEKSHVCGRKPVKRSLFQEMKKEVYEHSNSNKSETKTHCAPRNYTTSLSKASQLSYLRSPQISSNREILEKNQDTSFRGSEQKLFQTEELKNVELSPSHRNTTCNYRTSARKRSDYLSDAPQMSCSRSPQISSNRKILETNQDVLFHNFEQRLFQTEGTSTVELSTTHRNINIPGSKLLPETKMINVIDNGTIEVKKSSKSYCFSHKIDEISAKCGRKLVKKSLFQENKKEYTHCNPNKLKNKTHHKPHSSLITRPDHLSETSQMSSSKSPQISSNRKILEKNQNALFHNFEQSLFQTEGTRTIELSTTHRNSNIPGSKLLPETKNINIVDNSTIEIKKLSKSNCFSHKIDEISAKCGRKLVKRSLFQVNKKIFTPRDPNKLKNKTRHEPCNSLITITDGLYEGYVNREMLERNQNTSFHKSNSCLFQTESAKNAELSPSHSVNDTSMITSLHAVDQIRHGSKSPEIITGRGRWYTEHKDLDKMDVSGYDKFNINCKPQVSTKSNQKSENAHLSKVQSTLKPVDSEDIIESSESIHLPKNQQSKKKKHNKKKTKKKNYTDKNQVHKLQCNEKNETKLQKNKFTKSSEIAKMNENIMCDETNFDSLDIINTENMVKSPIIDLKIKRNRKKPKLESCERPNLHITELIKIENNMQRHCDDTYLVIQPSTSASPKEFAEQSTKENFKMFEPCIAEHYLNQDKDENILFTHFPKVRVIPSTPTYKSDKPAIEDYSSETHHLNSCVPFIEVDQSPKIQYENNRLMLIQSVQSPPNTNGTTTLPALFEPLASPTQSVGNSELPFKIDSIESPCAMYDNDNFVSPVSRKKKSDNSPSPNHFDSAKKRKKMCKSGLRGQFRDLINRKKSEACIREYEKTLSKSYQQKHGETALLNVIEAWKEFQTFVLLCYHRKSEMEVQKVLVTLDKCPKNATKNSIIRIYSPWLTIESKTTDVLLFVGVIHAEVIEFVESIRSIEPTGLFTNHINGLQTTMYQSEVLWKCNCSEEAACQCLGELSVYNYLQYMISH